MKPWAKMTERERDVLIMLTLGSEETEIPHFSTDRAAAMSLLDGFEWYYLRKMNDRFNCELPVSTIKGVSIWGSTDADTICRAFLRAKGIDIE